MRTISRTRNVALAVALVALPIAACGEDAEPVAVPTTGAEPSAVGENADGGAAQDSLEGRIGEQVDITGEVARVLSPDAFTVGGDEIGENPVLVVGADVPAGLSEGDAVTVTGTVKEFQVAGYEEDLDLDLVDDEFEDFDGDPAVQASSVSKT